MKKISKAKIATTYATALYQAALEQDCSDKVFEDVQKLAKALEKEPQFIAYMANPLHSDKDKISLLADVAQKAKLDRETQRCLNIVLENGRFAELPQILKSFEHLYYQKNNIAEVEVDSVKSLSAEQDKKLKDALEKLLGRKTVVTYAIKPDILGGLRVRFGSDMIDDTLARKLNRLEIMMKGE